MGETILVMKGIDKKFVGVHALKEVDFDLQRGEVHALMGENGAGKSTLMKVLTGIYSKDGGSIVYEGREVEFHTPKESQDAGISIVHQELNMMNHLTVAQNIFIGREPMRSGLIDDNKMNEDAKKLFERLNIVIDPTETYVESYLTIQKMRYKDKLRFYIEIEDEIRQNQIVKLVLQPIVENAIYHGIKYKEEVGFLYIHGYGQEDQIVIEIHDNGVGMDEETLQHIFDEHKVNYNANGVGIYNIQKRLHLYYGKEYGMHYESIVGEGTTVTVVIPRK